MNLTPALQGPAKILLSFFAQEGLMNTLICPTELIAL
jgi:hypothetical protein